MKILLTSDWHLRLKAPKNRTDDFFSAQFLKLKWILDKALDESCSAIIVAGDIFDSPQVPYEVTNKCIQMFKAHPIHVPVLTIYGQHDLRFHNLESKEKTPLNTLEKAGAVKTLSSVPCSINQDVNIDVYGCSWGEEIPTITDENTINILAIHRMIIHKEPLWPGQTDYTEAEHFLKKNNFNLIVSGDNHNPFVFPYKHKILVNPGSLMRQTSAQIEHKPRIYIYDTNYGEVEKHFIPISSIDHVMNLKKVEKEKVRNEELESFIETLKENRDIGLDFIANLQEQMKDDTNIDEDTRGIITEAIKGMENESNRNKVA